MLENWIWTTQGVTITRSSSQKETEAVHGLLCVLREDYDDSIERNCS